MRSICLLLAWAALHVPSALSNDEQAEMRAANVCASHGALEKISYDKRDAHTVNQLLQREHAYCICPEGTQCTGSKCSRGARTMDTPGAERADGDVAGFRFDCTDCKCNDDVNQNINKGGGGGGGIKGTTIREQQQQYKQQQQQQQQQQQHTNSASKTAPMLVTAASENHLCVLLQLLDNLRKTHPDHHVTVYDLDLPPQKTGDGAAPKGNYIERKHLDAVHPHIASLRRFNYSAYPPHFRIDEHAGVYAWKPLIIREVVKEHGAAICECESREACACNVYNATCACGVI